MRTGPLPLVPGGQPNFRFGAAVVLRLMADCWRHWSIAGASDRVDWGPWEERTSFSLMRDVYLLGRITGDREPTGLELVLQAGTQEAKRAVSRFLAKPELEQLAPAQIEPLLQELYQRATTNEAGEIIWPAWAIRHRLLDTCAVPVGTWVRVRVCPGPGGPPRRGWAPLRNNSRVGTVAGEVDMQTLILGREWLKYPPKHVFLVHFEPGSVRWHSRLNRPPFDMAYADYELELVEAIDGQ